MDAVVPFRNDDYPRVTNQKPNDLSGPYKVEVGPLRGPEELKQIGSLNSSGYGSAVSTADLGPDVASSSVIDKRISNHSEQGKHRDDQLTRNEPEVEDGASSYYHSLSHEREGKKDSQTRSAVDICKENDKTPVFQEPENDKDNISVAKDDDTNIINTPNCLDNPARAEWLIGIILALEQQRNILIPDYNLDKYNVAANSILTQTHCKEDSRIVSSRHDSSSQDFSPQCLTPVSPEEDVDIKCKQEPDPTPITPSLLSYIRREEPASKQKLTPLPKKVNRPRMNRAYELRMKAIKTKSTDSVTKIDKGPRSKKTSNKQKAVNRGLSVGQIGKADRVESNGRSSAKVAKETSAKSRNPSELKKAERGPRKEREITLRIKKPQNGKKSKRRTNTEEKMADTKSAVAEPSSLALRSLLSNQSTTEELNVSNTQSSAGEDQRKKIEDKQPEVVIKSSADRVLEIAARTPRKLKKKRRKKKREREKQLRNHVIKVPGNRLQQNAADSMMRQRRLYGGRRQSMSDTIATGQWQSQRNISQVHKRGNHRKLGASGSDKMYRKLRKKRMQNSISMSLYSHLIAVGLRKRGNHRKQRTKGGDSIYRNVRKKQKKLKSESKSSSSHLIAGADSMVRRRRVYEIRRRNFSDPITSGGQCHQSKSNVLQVYKRGNHRKLKFGDKIYRKLRKKQIQNTKSKSSSFLSKASRQNMKYRMRGSRVPHIEPYKFKIRKRDRAVVTNDISRFQLNWHEKLKPLEKHCANPSKPKDGKMVILKLDMYNEDVSCKEKSDTACQEEYSKNTDYGSKTYMQQCETQKTDHHVIIHVYPCYHPAEDAGLTMTAVLVDDGGHDVDGVDPNLPEDGDEMTLVADQAQDDYDEEEDEPIHHGQPPEEDMNLSQHGSEPAVEN